MYKVEGGAALKKLIKICIKNNRSMLISSPPGCGKSEITEQCCEELGMNLVEERLYLKEPGEAKGIPDVKEDSSGGLRTIWSRPSWLPEKENTVLFFDDCHLNLEIQQSALFELLLKRSINGHRTPDSTRFIAAGNFSTSGSGAQEILAPVMNRFDLCVEFTPTVNDFVTYAQAKKVNPKLLAFLMANPDYLFTAEPDPTTPFHSPRSWMNLDRNLKIGLPIETAVGTIGYLAGTKLVDSWEMLNRSKEEIMARPPMTFKDQVVAAAILSTYPVEKKILEWVQKNLTEESKFFYLRSAYLNQKHALLSFMNDPAFDKMFKEIVSILAYDDSNEGIVEEES